MRNVELFTNRFSLEFMFNIICEFRDEVASENATIH